LRPRQPRRRHDPRANLPTPRRCPRARLLRDRNPLPWLWLRIDHPQHPTHTEGHDLMRFFTHAKDCPTPNAQLDQASEGRLKCRTCKYVSPGPTNTTPATRTVCRDHHEQSVSAQGKGCSICAADRHASQKRKRAKRTKATEART